MDAVQQPVNVAEHEVRRSEPTAPEDWLTPGRFAWLLGALIFAAFPQVVLGLGTFVVRDFGFFAYPLAYYQRECFWRGELPHWNPYNNCGVPFLAQWNTMPLYPGSLVYLLFPLTWSLPFFCVAHLYWGGLGMYLLAHRWTGNRLAAAYIAARFREYGLLPPPQTEAKGTPYLQDFPFVISRKPGERNSLRFAGAGTPVEPEAGKQFQTLAFSADTVLTAPLVFAGYGISAADSLRYDDYSGMNVRGKVVVVMRYSPLGRLDADVALATIKGRFGAFERALFLEW